VNRILVTNAYSARNRGDAAILLGMIRALRDTEVFADAEIRISTADHPADAGAYPVPTVASFHSLKNGLTRIPWVNLLHFLVVLLPLALLWTAAWRLGKVDLPVPERLRALLREYSEADLIVAAGGGYLYTTSAARGNVVLIVTVASFLVGRWLGKPVVLYAQSIGPFASRAQEWFVRRALECVDLIEVREKISLRLLERWGLRTPLVSVADAAFLLEPREPEWASDAIGPGSGPSVGLTVRRWFRDPDDQAAYESSIAIFVDRLVETYGAEVVFVPQVTFTDGRDDDRESARRVAARTNGGDGVLVIEEELSAAEVKWLCGQMDFFVGTRMHSNIFALSSGVPSLAIAYQPKSLGIMESLGLAGFVLPIDTLNADELAAVFSEMVEREGEIRSRLEDALPAVREDALEGGRVIAGWWTRRQGDPERGGATS